MSFDKFEQRCQRIREAQAESDHLLGEVMKSVRLNVFLRSRFGHDLDFDGPVRTVWRHIPAKAYAEFRIYANGNLYVVHTKLRNVPDSLVEPALKPLIEHFENY